MRSLVFVVLVTLLTLAHVACSNDPPPTSPDGGAGGDGATGDGSGGDTLGWYVDDAGVVRVGDGAVLVREDGGSSWICHPTTCAGKLLACGDCIDNDGDGLIDARDPECLTPCDNTEGPALIGGVGGGGGATCKVDCYFDFGNGSGNDECVWDHRCDPLAPEANLKCDYDQSLVGGNKCPATQSPNCAKICLPYTPNGCDCFGCCTFPQLAGKGPNGSDGHVWIGAMDDKKQGTCTFKDIGDPKKCPPCTPLPNCYNACGKCELCIGKPLPPPECFKRPDAGPSATDGGAAPPDAGVPPSAQCPGGETPCGLAGQPSCAPGSYCISGCCQKVVIN